MNNIKAVIVDDSSFSVALIKKILQAHGVEVLGSAGTLDEVKQVVTEKKPNLVTMDMTLPGTDGFECTRAVHQIDASIRVIAISAMMDDEALKEAKRNHISAYIQKPIDEDELIAKISQITASDELYQCLVGEYEATFKETLLDGMNRMTKTLLTYKEVYSTHDEQQSRGMTIVVGISGKFPGRMLIDLSKEGAAKMAAAIFGGETASHDDVMAALSEFTNIVAGNACSLLNRKIKALGLRMAPPSILYGEHMLISSPDFSTTTAIAESDFGEIALNVGFRKGDAE